MLIKNKIQKLAVYDLKKSRWETGGSISDLDTKVSEPPTTAIILESHLIRQGGQLHKDTQEMGTQTAKLDQLINRFIIK